MDSVSQNKNYEPDAVLALASGEVAAGRAFGASATAVAGELCFNTSLSGYQEVLTDPSYKGQIIVFTAVHIGNVGTNKEDFESAKGQASGLVVREPITAASSHRADQDLDHWLKTNRIVGIAEVDTRSLVLRLREKGAVAAAITHLTKGESPEQAAKRAIAAAKGCPPMKRRELAYAASGDKIADWRHPLWQQAKIKPKNIHLVVVDYGAKSNIMRHLKGLGCKVTVCPAATAAADLLALKPHGILLSNGPGDPQATAAKCSPTIKQLLAAEVPIFGICLGHQLLALALGAKTDKMHHGHRGANHPVLELASNKVEVTSQNHGFVVNGESLPKGLEATHSSLFDGSLEGIRLKNKPVFSVQYHPEASPGPQDSHYLFRRFYEYASEYAER